MNDFKNIFIDNEDELFEDRRLYEIEPNDFTKEYERVKALALHIPKLAEYKLGEKGQASLSNKKQIES